MKTKLSLMCSLLFGMCYSQSETIGQLFELKANTTGVTYIGPDNVRTVVVPLVPASPLIVEEKVLYVVQNVDRTAGTVTFYAKPYAPNPSPISKAFYYNNRLFQMSYATYKANAKDAEYPDRFNFGILTLPFKFRPQKNAAFDSQFNLNATIGYLLTPKYFRKTRLYLQGGAGIGTVSVDATNSLAADSQNVSAITGFVGLMIQYEDVQAGLYFGADKINNNKVFDWEHQGNMWFSLGIGFKIFTLSKADEN